MVKMWSHYMGALVNRQDRKYSHSGRK